MKSLTIVAKTAGVKRIIKTMFSILQGSLFLYGRRRKNSDSYHLFPHLQNVDKWSFDVFALNDASGDHALKFIFYELLTRYDLISRFKVSNPARLFFPCCLVVFSKERNPNLMFLLFQYYYFYVEQCGITRGYRKCTPHQVMPSEG